LTGEAAVERARQDQGILEELEEQAKIDRRKLVDEYARMRDELKAQQREIDRLKMKLATGGAGSGGGGDLVEIGGVSVWTPRFEGLDRQAHSEVVKRWQNEHRDRPFILVSSSVADEGVHVITAVADSLKDRVKAPEVMKRLGLRGGGRPDFAQGGGVAAGDVDAMRRKAAEVAKEMLEGVGV
jgi:alanyl-tRNA synthetase